MQSNRLTVMELEIFCLRGQPIEIVGQVVMSIGVLRFQLDRETEHVHRGSMIVVPVRQGAADLVELFHELETSRGFEEFFHELQTCRGVQVVEALPQHLVV